MANKEQEYLEIGDRPWGQYFVLEDKQKFKVKRIVVKPGMRLSLQSHEQRSEHWMVVEGVATFEVRVGDQQNWVNSYHPGEYAYVPKQIKHRISNTGTEDVIIIEVQFGDYTGEDDIKRFEDDFGRHEG
jgi:mannose-6-phosphate isomerase-like protein (cupin superfamily)